MAAVLERLTHDELEALPINEVVLVGDRPSLSSPYKRTRSGWRRFYKTSRIAFGPASTSATIAKAGAWRPVRRPD